MKDYYCDTHFGKLRYWQAGDSGKSVVLIPGLGGSLENWQYNIDDLSKRFKVFVIEPIGFGRSDKPLIQYTLNVLSQSLCEFLKKMNLSNVSLVGNSLGGALAMHVATVSDINVNQLVLVGSAGFSRKLPMLLRFASLPLLPELLMRPSPDSARKLFSTLVYDSHCLSESFLKKMFELSSLPGNQRVLLSIIRSHINFFGMKAGLFHHEFKKVQQIRCPTLLIWGRQDKVMAYQHAKIALNTLNDAKLVTFEQCGHLPQVEKPQQFNQVVGDFLELAS